MTAEAVEFMRKFVGDLFKDSSAIPLDQKSKFGQLAQVFYCLCCTFHYSSCNRFSVQSYNVRLASFLENAVSPSEDSVLHNNIIMTGEMFLNREKHCKSNCVPYSLKHTFIKLWLSNVTFQVCCFVKHESVML
jgi:hypothetical protein